MSRTLQCVEGVDVTGWPAVDEILGWLWCSPAALLGAAGILLLLVISVISAWVGRP